MIRKAIAACFCASVLFTVPSIAEARSRGLPWCGIYLGKHLGKPDRKLWIARNWAHVGSPASPGAGVVVVWRHHVGIIVGRAANGQYIVHSGNDSGSVRTRPRSIAGAIAFRRV